MAISGGFWVAIRDFDPLTYFFAIDTVNTFNSSSHEQSPEIPEGINSTSWNTSELTDNTPYFWRARAYDQAAYSDWVLGSFFVNQANDSPSIPIIKSPQDNGEITTHTPTLKVYPSTDVDLDQITYDFELFLREGDIVSSAQGIGTEWQVDVVLGKYKTYTWRAQAMDEHDAQSGWTEPFYFSIKKTIGVEVSMFIPSTAQTIQIVKITDENSPIKNVSIEIPVGALNDDVTITIGVANNPPPLSENTKAIGRVIDFGPPGTTFTTPVSIMLPYTQADLDNAGITDPTLLEVYTYDTSKSLWEKVPIDNVDDLNLFLICQVNHFSLYTIGITFKDEEPIKTNSLKANNGCFLQFITP